LPAQERDHVVYPQFFTVTHRFLLRRNHLVTFSEQSKT
jgi:hypothetical protein